MFRPLLLIFVMLAAAYDGTGQERFVQPKDDGMKDPSFAAFRTKLIAAAERKYANYILGILDVDVTSSFGGHQGINDFKSFWKIDSSDSQFWREFLLVMRNGGTLERSRGKTTFTAPYLFSAMPADLDQFEYHAIFGKDVNLRERPNTDARVIARLSYNIVRIDEPSAIKRKTGTGESDWEYDWHKVETIGGKKGWVKAEFVRSPIDYRAGFEKKGRIWKMTFFVAGD